MNKLLLHDFTATKQTRHYSKLKEELKEGEFLVILDFAENYSFVMQNAAQGFHWNNDQASLFPIVVYYREDGKLKNLSIVGISDCLKHDTIAVYIFQRKLIDILKRKFPHIRKIIYYSDGAPQQFKNRKAFVNLCYHFLDFGVEAEWNFFATAHGKGPCDGIGGTVKRYAARASLQRGTARPILTPLELFNWAQEAMDNILFFYVEDKEYCATQSLLEERFAKAITLKGTLKYHMIIPLIESVGYVNVKTFSESEKIKSMRVIKS